MSSLAVSGVSSDYRHITKAITPGTVLELGGFATLKWYDIAPPDAPVPAEIDELARRCFVDEVVGGAIELEGLGFVILHRCGEAFYFLLVCTWAGNNELGDRLGEGRCRRRDVSAVAGSARPPSYVLRLGARSGMARAAGVESLSPLRPRRGGHGRVSRGFPRGAGVSPPSAVRRGP